MRTARVALAVRVVLVVAVIAAVVPASAAARSDVRKAAPDEATSETARIAGAYPNPLADGDRGEYVSLVLPPGNWTLSDGEIAVRVVGPGRVVLADAPSALPNGTDGGVVTARVELSNAGERLVLRRGGPNGRIVDAVEYRDAPEGEVLLPGETPRWRPVGYDPREPVSLGPANATAFMLPDAPGVAVETLRGADRRLLLAGYTFGSTRVAEALAAAARRGVRVRVLVEGSPVGGVSALEARLLDRLVAAGVEVRVLAGPTARFRFHHAKYAVVDDAALVVTENWKPAGTGGASSRGWGVRLESSRAADALAALFREDAGARDAVPWRTFRRGRRFEPVVPATGEYPRRFPPARTSVRSATLLTAPGNAESGVVGVIDRADARVSVIQPTIERGPLLAACRRGARRGVRVRVLVSSAWYVRETNEALVGWLNQWAERTGAPLQARLADPGGRFEKIHAKGVVTDDAVVVDSLNWNPTSTGENREVVVVLEGEAVAEYYHVVFLSDWRGGGSGLGGGVSVPLGLAAVAAAAGVILYAVRRVEFA